MSGFLLFILFLFNLLTIFAVIVLYLRQSKYAELEQSQKRTAAEMEDLLTSYLFEMQEENEKLLKALERPAQKKQEKAAHDETLEKGKTLSSKGPGRQVEAETEADDLPPLPIEVEDKLELSSAVETGHSPHEQNIAGFKQVLEQERSKKEPTMVEQAEALEKEGLSREEIARRLGKGRTEIDLLMKFKR